MDNQAPGLGWWKGTNASESIADSPPGIGYPSVSYYGVFSDSVSPAHMDQLARKSSPNTQPGVRSSSTIASISVLHSNPNMPNGRKPYPREGRTWWMGVEGGIGYCQGGP